MRRGFRRVAVIGLALVGLIAANVAVVVVLGTDEGTWLKNRYDYVASGRRAGFLRRTYWDDAGNEHRYVVFVPYGLEPGTRPPMIVFLHGYSGNGDDGVQHILECLGPRMWESRSEFPFIVLFPQCPAGSSWGATDVAGRRAMALLRHTKREYNVDPDRISVTGVSSGGSGAWSLASSFPEIFAAAIPVSGAPSSSDSAHAIAKAGLPIWSFYVHGDGSNVEDSNRRMQNLLLKDGASPLFTEIDGTLSEKWWKHNAWGVAYNSHATWSWLLSQSRTANAANRDRPFRPIPAGPQWVIDDEGSLRPAPADSGDGPATASCDPLMQNYELHFEFRLEAGQQFDLLMPGHDDAGVSLQIVHPDEGSGGAYESSSGALVSTPPPTAQRALYRRIWNDMRLRIDGDRLLVEANGWRLYDLRHDALGNRTGKFEIRAHSRNAGIGWRNFRIREIAAKQIESETSPRDRK